MNKFFEPPVRIQTDRGHKVIDTGPYAIVRHPGYAFGFLFFLGMPLALGSLWALIPAMLLVPAPGRADDLGGPDAAGRVAGLQGVRPASPIPAGSWGLVIEPINSTDMTTTLPHFSVPAQDETMAPLGICKRSVVVKDRAMDETKSPSETEGTQPPGRFGGSQMRRKPLRNRSFATSAEGSGGSTLGDPRRSGAIESSGGSVRAASVGSIWPTTTTSTAPWRSRCRTRSESLAPRMSRRI